MLGLRQKISLGFGGLLIIILVIGIQSILNLSRLGESIDVILRENYRSVIACQQMKEALERIDSGLLFTLLGDGQQGEELILKNEGVFEKALQVELNTITLAGRGRKSRPSQGPLRPVRRGCWIRSRTRPSRRRSAMKPISRASSRCSVRSRPRRTISSR